MCACVCRDPYDKTMDDKLIYTPNYDKLNYLPCRLKSFVEKFRNS